jgi:putative membrane-bound dehydrogenase-like protein
MLAKFVVRLLVSVTLVAVIAPRCLAQQNAPIRELFDGRSLAGWDGDTEHWRVEDGVIVGEIQPGTQLRKNTWLVWQEGTVGDFDLRLQVKLTGAPAANSGIQFRCQVDNVDHVSGYQADLDMGATWLGRIYDEHGRALLVERGTRVQIAPDGERRSQSFAPAQQYAVLFRENDWNDYRIVAVGDHVAVFVNGTLFSELKDEQTGERDLQGQLAFQLHSGPETRVEFRNIRLETLDAKHDRLGAFSIPAPAPADRANEGVIPQAADGAALNLGFEDGTLKDWTATGDAFSGQPINRDGIAARWQGQSSNKDGEFFIGGYEVVRDGGTGSLTSVVFRVTHPYASFLFGGGDTPATRVELVRPEAGDDEEMVLFTAVGHQREQMRRVVADLRKWQGQYMFVRLVDESRGGWGHLNFDDFRFHDKLPAEVEAASSWRSTSNPLLQHLVANPAAAEPTAMSPPGADTAAAMSVPPGFSVDVIAAEPQLHQPMAFTFDARGRLWVVEGHSYPQKRPKGEGLDRILIFADRDGDGSFETRTVFCDGLNLVSGMEVGHGGVWVGAAPELLFIPDRDGDDRPDSEPQVLLDGFGYADTHETLNSLLWGPDGWLYGNQGVFNRSLVGRPGTLDEERVSLQAGVWRYHPTRHQFEVFAHGGSNQWGLDFDEQGQIFMTHCRSYWGQGPTTHVMQGGHYWNQVNSGYAPFVSATPLSDRPHMRNYLLASARYGHGEGGAGKAGSREVYGGHSHVGTMIYLGDNWPAEYRNHLFTHNLHGHQINHQVNVREAGGYNTRHAGHDVLFCADQQYIGVDLQYGPDGAVYISDWYDPRHCHNPNVEHWDRGNGRLYRMKFDATWNPTAVDHTATTDEELAEAQLHPNDWHVRMARQVLSERATKRSISRAAIQKLYSLATQHADADRRLRGLWALYAIGAFDADLADLLLQDQSESIRAWTVQLMVESLEPGEYGPRLRDLAGRDDSLLVRRYLASALQRVPEDLGWHLATVLSHQPENASDRDLPQLIWYGLAGLVETDIPRALALADETAIPALSDYIHWYAARVSDEGRQAVARRLAEADGAEVARLLTLFELGVRGMRGLTQPEDWAAIGPQLYDAPDARSRNAAQSIGAAFGDRKLFTRMRGVLGDENADTAARKHALAILERDSSLENLPVFLDLLDDAGLRQQVLPLLSRYDDPLVSDSLLKRLPDWQDATARTAMEVLASRAEWALQVLDAVAAGELDKSRLTAYDARQMASLGSPVLSDRLAREWGSFGQSSAQIRQEIDKTVAAYQSAPLWAYSAQAGAEHFKKLCAACHEPGGQNERIAPILAGSGSKGIGYVVENIIDPNAVIGRDFQARLIVTTDGRVISGLIETETDSAITLRTANDRVTVPRSQIEEIGISENSFMPVELLKPLNDRERIELLKYLMSL